MKRLAFMGLTILLALALTVCFANSLTVMDAYDLLTPDEVEDGVLFDPDSLFTYVLLEDGTVMLVRYTWVAPRVTVPTAIDGIRVSWIGAHAFTDTPVEELILPLGISIDADAFSYSCLKTIRICFDSEL